MLLQLEDRTQQSFVRCTLQRFHVTAGLSSDRRKIVATVTGRRGRTVTEQWQSGATAL
jgi:hypothetical protein